MRLFLAVAVLIAVSLSTACGDDNPTSLSSITPSPTPTAATSRTPTATTSPTPTFAPTAASSFSPPPPTEQPHPVPGGFPIDPNMHLGVVVGPIGSRHLVFDGSGPIAYDYALNDQPSGDPERANRSGWNCDTHYEYESAPAVDFYIADGTPIVATMDGTATLYAISNVNDFDRYGVNREPYLGNPDRNQAPYSPFPGPSSGLGVYVHLENADYITEYGHLDLAKTASLRTTSDFADGWSSAADFTAPFPTIIDSPRVTLEIARWQVSKGDVIGMSGDSGYSEGPHVHYTVARTGGPNRCPTNEAGYTDGGWLFK